MRSNERGFGFLDEVWLSIVTSVVTALLVNILTGFTFGTLPIVQVIVISVTCIMIGLHAGKRSETLAAIDKRIEIEGLSREDNAGKISAVVREEWEHRGTFLKFTLGVTFILIAASVILLFYQGFTNRRRMESEILFRREMIEQIAEIRAAMAMSENVIKNQDLEQVGSCLRGISE
ncbi:MAG TPA: hypothetical protein PLY86_16025 [bacterium]|nr:hypothetical protein [bacterium]